jgi:hypothetical protein
MLKPRDEANPYPKLLDWLRYFCAFMLYMYGISKLMHLQFNMSSQLAHQPIGSLNGYQLTWFYFGYSRAYASILGLTQVVGATLFLFRKITLLAAVLMFPVMANILLINVFILINDYGPYLMSALISASILTILWHHRLVLLRLLWITQNTEPWPSSRAHWWIRTLIALAASGIMISGAILQHYVNR